MEQNKETTKYIIRKNNGIVLKSEYSKLISSKPFLVESEQCFKQELDYSKIEDIKIQNINQINNLIANIIKDFNAGLNVSSELFDIYECLKNVSTREDLIDVANKLKNAYISNFYTKDLTPRVANRLLKDINRRTKMFELLMEENFEILISIIIKKVSIYYYANKIKLLGKNKISELASLLINGSSLDEMFEMIGETFSEIAKSNGMYDLSCRIFKEFVDKIDRKNHKHLCWDGCKNARADYCPKVRDKVKKEIGDYSFIRNGYQIVTASGSFDEFVVSDCEKFEMEVPKKLTSDELKRIEHAKESLKTMYYDAEDLNEAEKIETFTKKYDRAYNGHVYSKGHKEMLN